MAGATGKSATSAESTPQGGGAATEASVIQSEPATAGTPKWVIILMESNAAVLASNEQLKSLIDGLVSSNDEVRVSNEAVIQGIEAFKANASELIGQIIDGAKQSTAVAAPEAVKVVAQYDPDAEYLVANGQTFVDRKTTKVYAAGEEVPHMEQPRMQKLLDLGIIEEA